MSDESSFNQHPSFVSGPNRKATWQAGEMVYGIEKQVEFGPEEMMLSVEIHGRRATGPESDQWIRHPNTRISTTSERIPLEHARWSVPQQSDESTLIMIEVPGPYVVAFEGPPYTTADQGATPESRATWAKEIYGTKDSLRALKTGGPGGKETELEEKLCRRAYDQVKAAQVAPSSALSSSSNATRQGR